MEPDAKGIGEDSLVDGSKGEFRIAGESAHHAVVLGEDGLAAADDLRDSRAAIATEVSQQQPHLQVLPVPGVHVGVDHLQHLAPGEVEAVAHVAGLPRAPLDPRGVEKHLGHEATPPWERGDDHNRAWRYGAVWRHLRGSAEEEGVSPAVAMLAGAARAKLARRLEKRAVGPRTITRRDINIARHLEEGKFAHEHVHAIPSHPRLCVLPCISRGIRLVRKNHLAPGMGTSGVVPATFTEHVQVSQHLVVEHDAAHGPSDGLLVEGGPQPDLVLERSVGHVVPKEALEELAGALQLSVPELLAALAPLALDKIAPLPWILVHEDVDAGHARDYGLAQVRSCVHDVFLVGRYQRRKRRALQQVCEEGVVFNRECCARRTPNAREFALNLGCDLAQRADEEGEILLGALDPELDGPLLLVDGGAHAEVAQELQLRVGEEVLAAEGFDHLHPYALCRSHVPTWLGCADLMGKPRLEKGFEAVGDARERRAARVRGTRLDESCEAVKDGSGSGGEVRRLHRSDAASHALEVAEERQDDDEDELGCDHKGDEDERPRSKHGTSARHHSLRGADEARGKAILVAAGQSATAEGGQPQLE
mmetsp:Transcript_18304/g.53349  ORF Transcript_18304/g.53349 Transcript_18304/m.53349 type:complete len:592 (+) Transcript_18304:2134-3909(+)